MVDGMGAGRRLRRAGLVLCLGSCLTGLVAWACGDSPVSPSGQANLTILLTDDLTDEVDQVNITFTSVTVKPVGEPVVELDLELTEVDLLELGDNVTPLATGLVEPGEYEFVHINIDGRESHIVEETGDGVRTSLQVPSEEVKILGGFTVGADHQTTLTLDFDAEASLIHLGNGEWLLQPIIVMTGNNVSSQSVR